MIKAELEKKAREYLAEHSKYSEVFGQTFVAVDTLTAMVDFAEQETKKLEAQIEKMKNWCNCKNYSQCLIELAEQGKGMKPSECCVNCKKWELEDYRTRLERRNKKKQEIKEK